VAAVEAGDHAGGNTEQHGNADRYEADIERDARSKQDAREHVAPQLVGAHEVVTTRFEKSPRDLRGRVGRRQQRGEDRNHDHRDDDHQANQPDRILSQHPLVHAYVMRGSR